MVNAGRILIVPKGVWSSLTSYDMLDLVTQDGVAYIARQANVGVQPKTDSQYTYWQPFGNVAEPDNETIVYDENNKYTVNLDGKMLVYDGDEGCITVAIDGTTIKFDEDEGYLYANVKSNLADLLDVVLTTPANGQTLVYDSATQKWKNGQGPSSISSVISDDWEASTTYKVGQYCIYNNSLWKCLVQHSGQTPEEGTYWTKVNVANEITLVNNSIQNELAYSETETICGIWKDGRPIYRKIVHISSGSIPIQTNVWNSLGITIPNIDKLIYANICLYPNIVAFTYSNNELKATTAITQFVIGSAQDIVVEYTKTTD